MPPSKGMKQVSGESCCLGDYICIICSTATTTITSTATTTATTTTTTTTTNVAAAAVATTEYNDIKK